MRRWSNSTRENVRSRHCVKISSDKNENVTFNSLSSVGRVNPQQKPPTWTCNSNSNKASTSHSRLLAFVCPSILIDEEQQRRQRKQQQIELISEKTVRRFSDSSIIVAAHSSAIPSRTRNNIRILMGFWLKRQNWRRRRERGRRSGNAHDRTFRNEKWCT